jgi:hypothetical protein
MKLNPSIIVLAGVGLTLYSSNLYFPADAIEHHGFKVKDWGSGAECVSCHNGTRAKRIPPCMPVCDLAKSHPVGTAYPPEGREDEFRSTADARQSGANFVDERLDCVSCHNLLNKSPNHLRFPPEQNYCSACHRR